MDKNLQLELYEILSQEEKLCATKSRTNWIRDRDCNTNFFHLTTVVEEIQLYSVN